MPEIRGTLSGILFSADGITVTTKEFGNYQIFVTNDCCGWNEVFTSCDFDDLFLQLKGGKITNFAVSEIFSFEDGKCTHPHDESQMIEFQGLREVMEKNQGQKHVEENVIAYLEIEKNGKTGIIPFAIFSIHNGYYPVQVEVRHARMIGDK